ncbi:hypothetical protein LV779_35505 [Streptomyces thinghirensis]|nr:hypothetical protein [Streptomyces thinghirensis]
MAELLAAGAREVVVKRGGEGPTCTAPTAGISTSPPTASRSSTHGRRRRRLRAGYLSGLLDGLAPADRLRRAAPPAPSR